MIAKTLGFLAAQLNDHMSALLPDSHHVEHVIVGSMRGADGAAGPESNKIVLSLLNLEREVTAPATALSRRGAFQRMAPALHLNLYVLVAVTFDSDYGQTLRLLDEVLGFFQAKPDFLPQTAAGMPAELNRLSVEFVGMNLAELNNVWAVLGTKYLPSALYKVRMLTIQGERLSELLPGVRAAVVEVGA